MVQARLLVDNGGTSSRSRAETASETWEIQTPKSACWKRLKELPHLNGLASSAPLNMWHNCRGIKLDRLDLLVDNAKQILVEQGEKLGSAGWQRHGPQGERHKVEASNCVGSQRKVWPLKETGMLHKFVPALSRICAAWSGRHCS